MSKLNIIVRDNRVKCEVRLIGQKDQSEINALFNELKQRIIHDVDLPEEHYYVTFCLVDLNRRQHPHSRLRSEWPSDTMHKNRFDVVFRINEGKAERVEVRLGNLEHEVHIDCTSLKEFVSKPLNVLTIKLTLQKYFTDQNYRGTLLC